MILGLIILLAAILGSFYTACIYRIPLGRKKGLESFDEPEELEPPTVTVTIVDPPRSFCPACNHQLAWYNNIPVLSFVFQRGTCAYCQSRIPAQYLIVELLSILFALLSYHTFGLTWNALAAYAIASTLLVLSFIDIDYFILPNVITYPMIIVGCAVSIANQWLGVLTPPFNRDATDAAVGLLVGAGFLWGVSALYELIRRRQGLGFGDVKLLAAVGVWLGWQGSFFTIFLGSLVGCVLGVGQLLLAKRGLGQPLPFGPYLALGTLLYMFDLADPIISIFVVR